VLADEAMKIMIILNPRSRGGSDRHLESSLKEGLGNSHLEISRTAAPGHATEIAQLAVRKGFDTVVAVGGDGTVSEVLNGIVGSDVALGIIPTGTANDLASLYDLPTDIESACDVIRKRHVTQIDLISVNDQYYVTAGGVGFPCEVANLANTIKRYGRIGQLLARILGSKLYVLAVVAAWAAKAKRNNLLDIRCNNHSLSVDALSMMVNNQSFLGRSIIMSPGAVNNDGAFDICLIENSLSRLKILQTFMRTLNGTHVFLPFVRSIRASDITVKARHPLPFFGDGEIIQQNTSFSIRLIPKALKLVIPVKKVSG
jgi:diacylglycerol kinase (ATP)